MSNFREIVAKTNRLKTTFSLSGHFRGENSMPSEKKRCVILFLNVFNMTQNDCLSQ